MRRRRATRVPEVIDAWYDSGSMPFAQFGYPHRNKELFERSYPAQFICEAIDQTRGWFYTLMAVGTLVFDRSSYENVVCLGPHPGRGRPQDVQAPGQHPRADPADGPARRRRGALVHGLRSARPWSARRVGHTALQEVVRKTLLTYWNTVAFQALYGRTAGWAPSARRPGAGRPAGAGPLGALRAAHRWCATSTRRWTAFDTQRGRQAARRVRRRPVQLVRAPLAAAASGAATRPRWRTLHEALRR